MPSGDIDKVFCHISSPTESLSSHAVQTRGGLSSGKRLEANLARNSAFDEYCVAYRTMEKLMLEVDCKTVKAKLDAGEDFMLLDCREQREYDLVSIEGAVLIPMGEIPERIAELEPCRNREVIVHCHHGGRSLSVVRWLRERGFTQAFSMAGGIDEWAQDIAPGLKRY